MLCLRQGWAAVLLLLLGLLASVAVTFYMSAVPDLFGTSDCDEVVSNPPRWLVGDQEFDGSECWWRSKVKALADDGDVWSVKLDRHLKVVQADGRPRIVLTASAPTDSALVHAVSEGHHTQNITSFVEGIWGVPLVNRQLPDWQYPKLTLRSSAARATIEVDGTFPTRTGTISQIPQGPTTLNMTVTQQHIAAVDTSWQITAQDPHHLSARATTATQAELLSITLAAGTAPPHDTYAERADPRRVLPWVWHEAIRMSDALANEGNAALSAAGWCALVLSFRAGALSGLGGQELTRLTRLAGVVLTVHGVLWTANGVDQAADVGVMSGTPAARLATRLLGWEVTGYWAFTGVVVLLTCTTLVVLPTTVWQLRQDLCPPTMPPSRLRRHVGPAAALLAVAALCAAASALYARAWLQYRTLPDERQTALAQAVTLPVLLFGFLVVLCLLTMAVARWAGWRLRLWPLVTCSAVVPLFAVAAEMTGNAGTVPNLLNWAVPGLVGGVAVLATACAATVAFGSPRRLGGRVLLLLYPVAFALAVTWHWASSARPNWWDLASLGQDLDTLSGLILAAVTVRGLRSLGGNATTTPHLLRRHRALGIVLVFALAAGSLTLSTQTSSIAVAAAAITTWLAFPYGQIRLAAAVLAQAPAERAARLRRAVRSGTDRRSLAAARKATREAISEGPRPYAAAHNTLRALERRSFDRTLPLQGGILVSERQLAFGDYLDARPWARGVRAARLGAVIGAPFTALSLAGAAVAAATATEHPVSAVLATAAPILLTWAGFGLLYGYFFPLLRGSTGFSKALSLYGVIVVPAVCHVLASPRSSHWTAWTQTLLYALEALAFAMTLGLRADSEMLAAHSMRPARLADLHNLGTITAWWSTVAAALATGAATLIIAGLQPFLLDVFPQHIAQPTPAPSPAVTTHSAP